MRVFIDMSELLDTDAPKQQIQMKFPEAVMPVLTKQMMDQIGRAFQVAVEYSLFIIKDRVEPQEQNRIIPATKLPH